jgi:hypothetical protein
MTWIRLKKSYDKFPIGRLLNKSTPAAKEMVSTGIAEFYNGPRPPVEKMRTNLFKPK